MSISTRSRHSKPTRLLMQLLIQSDRLSYVDVTSQVQRGEKPTPPKHEDFYDNTQEDVSEAAENHSVGNGTSEGTTDDNDDGDEMNLLALAGDVMTPPSALPPPPPPPGPLVSAVQPPSKHDRLTSQPSRHSQTSIAVEPPFLVQTPIFGAPSFSPVSPTAHSDSAINIHGLSHNRWQEETLSFATSRSQDVGSFQVNGTGMLALTSTLQSPGSASALRGLPEGFSDEACLHLREACLLRHFANNLAPWVSIANTPSSIAIFIVLQSMALSNLCPV